MQNIISVLLPINEMFPLHYSVCESILSNLQIGDLVLVPFRNRSHIGIVWELFPLNTSATASSSSIFKSTFKIKSVIEKITFAKVDTDTITLIKKASKYYMQKLGSIAKLSLPVAPRITNPEHHIYHDSRLLSKLASEDEIREDLGAQDRNVFNIHEDPSTKSTKQIASKVEFRKKSNTALPPLSHEQQDALKQIQNTNKPVVLKGVTGSGKTEVFFHLLSESLKSGHQVLILLPEIAITQQIVKRFYERFLFEPIVWNASISKKKKEQYLYEIMSGKALLIIGARSSLFLPYPNLSLIIVDEEHDPSYKQEEGVRYNARDMAVMRWHISNKIKVVLSSATPSIETIYNADKEKYCLVEIKTRFDNATLPTVQIIDMQNQPSLKKRWISDDLAKAIESTIQQNEQVLLFLNRRGYAPVLLCAACGYRFNCISCSTWLVMHKYNNKLECHRCDYSRSIPDSCDECSATNKIVACGPGIERIAEEVQMLFPKTKISIISKDQSSSIKSMNEILAKMESNEIQILIGTQVITKGYHFPNLTLVGVIDGDLGFISPDVRSAERNYQLLQQVAGRAGRNKKPGTVLIQSYFPDNTILQSIKNYDEIKFLQYEFEHRSQHQMPPFAKMASITISSKKEKCAIEYSRIIANSLPKTHESDNVKILGPTKAPIYLISKYYRYKILITTNKEFPIQRYLSYVQSVKIQANVKISIDIDPQSFF